MFRNLSLAAGFCVAFAGAASAVTLGQPLYVAEANGSGSVLDFFMSGEPSGQKELSAGADITEEFGTSGFLGERISYSMDLGGNGTLSLGSYVLDINTFTAGFGGASGDDFADTGLISTTFEVNFPVISFRPDPLGGLEILTLDLDPFGAGMTLETKDPFVEIGVNIFYDAPLPTKTFDSPFFGPVDFIEGIFDVTRIEVGLIGGAPVPDMPQVPLPAGGILMLTALAGFGAVGRARRSARAV